jgi:hypothetical protein
LARHPKTVEQGTPENAAVCSVRRSAHRCGSQAASRREITRATLGSPLLAGIFPDYDQGLTF